MYIIDEVGNFVNGTRMQIQNVKLKDLKIEKQLPLLESTLIPVFSNKQIKAKTRVDNNIV